MIPREPPPSPRNFLARMREAVRRELASGYYDRRPTGPRPPPVRSLRRALQGPAPARGAHVLLELKHVSPGYSAEPLPALEPRELARRTAGADVVGYSVLTQPEAFAGRLEELEALARATDSPVLFKDFVLDVRQVEAARAWGASAVLLIARFLEGEGEASTLPHLVDEVHRAGMEALVEVHAPRELPALRTSRADVIGVNARDLESLEVDLEGACSLLGSLRGEASPRVGMSGVDGPVAWTRYVRAGAQGVLVGTAFSRAADPEAFLRSLRVTPFPTSPEGHPR